MMSTNLTPNFQYFMIPLLEYLGDGEERTTQEALQGALELSNLSKEQRQEKLPSGKSKAIDRIHWAKTYLGKAGLLDQPSRGKVRITDRGRQALMGEEQVNNKYLMKFPEFREFRSQTTPSTPEDEEGILDTETPEGLIASGSEKLEAALVEELKQKLAESSPTFFEELVLRLLVAMGYGGSMEDAAETLGGTGDGGVDGVIKEDSLGLGVIYVQAKRWQGTVPIAVVREFAGSLQGHHATKGVLITTSKFPRDAAEYVRTLSLRIALIDGDELARLMVENNIGVSLVAKYDVKKVDQDFFTEGV